MAEAVPAPADADVYARAILGQLPRVLGMMDRDAFGPTHGCLDRTYWAWKFTDFAGARFQEGLCALAYAWATPFPGNELHGRPRLREWIGAGFDWWTRIQRPGGDLDEAYPLERSLAATAFTSFYLAEAWHFLDGDLPEDTRDRFLRGLERAGDWLCRNDEHHGFLSNHLAAAAGALAHAHRLTGAGRFETRCGTFLERILAHQSCEGWYDEYGGADPGYQTHGSFYLARCLELGVEPKLRDSLDRSFRFLAHFVHPDGSLAGEYASRNTQTYYPAAFEMRAGESGAARWIADRMRPSVASLAAAGLGSVDPYNLFPLLNNYVFAHRALAARPAGGAAAEGPEEGPGVVEFPDAGLVKVRRPRYDLFVGTAKGGVVKVFDREARRLVASDCGWIGRLRGGGTLSSQGAAEDRRVRVSPEEIVIEGPFQQISRPVMTPFSFLGFRAFMLTVGRFPAVARLVKSLLVRVLIYRKRDVPLRFTRTIRPTDDGVEIRDRIAGDAPVERLARGELFTTIHMGSSRYFVPNELDAPPLDDADRAPVAPDELPGGVERVRRIAIG